MVRGSGPRGDFVVAVFDEGGTTWANSALAVPMGALGEGAQVVAQIHGYVAGQPPVTRAAAR